MHSLAIAIEILTTVLTLAGLGYYLLALWSARSFAHSLRKPPSNYHPAVSILKPVKGLDPNMYESFASHCRQHYAGEYELVFGVSSLDDPAVAAVKRLQDEFPERDIRLVVCPDVLGTNGKVSNLVQILPHAQFDYVLINDSDIQVSPHYLTRIMAHFGEAHHKGGRVGMVTAPYRGKTHGRGGSQGTIGSQGTLGSKMEALGISTDFIPGVLTARQIEDGIHFALGSTLAISREALDAIGGLLPLVDYLADDFELGVRVAGAGFEVALSGEVVETFVPAYNIRQFLRHQIRWARSTRDSRRWGYAGLAFTFGLPWAIFTVIVSGVALWSIALLSLVLVARVALALSVGVGILRDRQVLRDLWLLIPRDLFALGIWVWSFAGNDVAWRGEVFSLKDGKLHRVVA